MRLAPRVTEGAVVFDRVGQENVVRSLSHKHALLFSIYWILLHFELQVNYQSKEPISFQRFHIFGIQGE